MKKPRPLWSGLFTDRTAVYRLNVESWSGKQGWKDPDHPGAYDLDQTQTEP
ncbi:hypothetical protein ACFQH3_17210 [Haladaptatus sp. GCM10025707]|uniref:hypothetical protein n=1 Tax=unclassified Haladaptatus TaxID=2622732 RepID=UPI0023E7A922|nr:MULTISPECIES: hypothetical protein [unclassified Haladaptatus]